jgi:hypothetical protein
MDNFKKLSSPSVENEQKTIKHSTDEKKLCVQSPKDIKGNNPPIKKRETKRGHNFGELPTTKGRINKEGADNCGVP